MSAGYIYVLINACIPGAVKIGITTRTAEHTAREISQGTGVPTPYVVAFEEEVFMFRFTINTEEWCGFFLGVLGTAGQKSWSSLRAWTSAVPSAESIMHACQGQGRSIIRADATHPPGSRYG